MRDRWCRKLRHRLAAHNIAAHPEQGWTLLCNGVIVFDDLGFLLPTGCRETGAETNTETLAFRARRVLPAPASPILDAAA